MKCLLSSILILIASYSVCQNCNNVGFENGDFSNWIGYKGSCCGGTITIPGIVNGRHTITSGTGTDINSNNLITYVAPGGGKYSVRLGNDNVGSKAERLKTTFLVDQSNASFTYQYALILQDPRNHPPVDKPKFEVRVIDQSGQVVGGPCGYYQVTAGPATKEWYKYQV